MSVTRRCPSCRKAARCSSEHQRIWCHKALGQALQKIEADDLLPPRTLAAIRIILRTGCRPHEIMTAELAWVQPAILLAPDFDLQRGSLRQRVGGKAGHPTAGRPRERVGGWVVVRSVAAWNSRGGACGNAVGGSW